ncbi:MAG: 3-methyl-2-oxobutanoate hydroxymethyltransferase [Lachnospiraceae bacterium]|nr:3-methyl-2-oxobutanoate hydroxymethyltransferase [Lachnospiraceae bacterium]
MKKKTIPDFINMKANGEKVTWITGYDYLTAKYIERAGMDMILVGDSLGMVQLGYDTTFPVEMDDMVRACQSVRRGAPNTFIVGDMPYMSYQESDEEAIHNAGRLIKEGGADCVKLEGGTDLIVQRMKAITGAGIAAIGHIGLTPQFMAQIGGYKAQGKSADAALKLIDQAKKLEAAGAWSTLIEGVPTVVGKAVCKACSIPIYGIGAGSQVDGQLIIYADMVGYYDDFCPKFVKKYAEVGKVLQGAFTAYVEEVRSGAFPEDDKHTYKIDAEQAALIEKMIEE